jgi:hypothetical protein
MENYNRQQKIDFLSKMVLPKVGKSDAKQRKFLFSCLSDLGYMEFRKKENIHEDHPDEVFYSEIKNENPLEDNFTLGAESWERTSKDYGFSRTFIGPGENYQAERLAEVQKRGISNQETEYNAVKEIFENALNQLTYTDTENVKKMASEFYLKIMNYYLSNSLNLPTKSGALKRGYIAYCLYYALLNHHISIPKEQLVHITGASLSDLPKASKNINLIIPGINKINLTEDNLCNMKSFLFQNFGNDVIQQINKVITDFKNKGNSVTNSVVAAAIYYVCSIPQSKGGIYPQRLKIKKENDSLVSFTYEMLKEFCGNLTKDTVRKNVNNIIEMYKK